MQNRYHVNKFWKQTFDTHGLLLNVSDKKTWKLIKLLIYHISGSIMHGKMK